MTGIAPPAAAPEGSASDELEALWALPAPAVRGPAPRPPRPRVPRPTIFQAWVATMIYSFAIAFFGGNAAEPSWAGELQVAFVLGLVSIALLALLAGPRGAYLGSATTAAIGSVLAYACGASEHHAYVLAGIELVLFAAIAVASFVAALRPAAGRQATSKP
ncbi:MAG TPA: hypothetical protein VH950_01340 [Gaiellaceae bacterium]